VTAGRASQSTAALLERDDELSTLKSLIDAAGRGESAIVLVEGRAGIGKSRLIAAARERAADAGLRTLAARGTDLERDFPYGVVRQLFEPLRADPDGWDRWLSGSAATASSVFEAPGGDASSPRDGSFAALHGLYWLTVNLCADQPLVLVVDDIHWCDVPSLRFLAYLAPRLEDLPLLILGGRRTAEHGTDPGLLADIAADPATITIGPGPLSQEAVVHMLADRLGAPPDERFAQACVEATGGNPLLVGHLISSLASENVVPTGANVDTVRAIGPRAVSRTVLLRLARQSPEAIATAHAIAVLGDHADVQSVASLAGIDESAVATASADLARTDILRVDGPLGFSHPLVHEAVYRDLAPAERELRHAAAARMLAESGAPPEQIATHLLVVPRRGDRWVVDTLREAADSALRRGAPDSAVAYLRRALEEPPPDDVRTELRYQAGLAEVAKSGHAGLEHLEMAYRDLMDPRRRADVAFRIAWTSMFTGSPDRASEVARRALAELPAELEDERMMLQTIEYCTAWFAHGDMDRLGELAAYRQSPRHDGVGAKFIALCSAFEWMHQNGPKDACVAIAREAIEDGTLIDAEPGVSPVAAAVILTLADRPEVTAHWEDTLARASRGGSLFGSLTVHIWGAWTLYEQGELDDAERSIHAGREETWLWGVTPAGAAQAAGLACSVMVARGRLSEARAILESEPREPIVTFGGIYWRRAYAELALAEGDPSGALAAADELDVSWSVNPAVNPWRGLKAEALDALGRTDEAIEVAQEELELARRGWGAARTIGRSLRILGTLKRDEGVDDLREAAALLERSTARLERVKALLALGGALRRARQPTEAREPLRRALELAESCGAHALMEQSRAELAAAGARPRTTAMSGVESLTASERRVTALAVEGRTNKDIAQELYVTPKTVEVHLSNAYRKLGIRSRHELAGALQQ
jgi:DNA-binding CsgD family transcriptional regulator